MPNIEVQLPAGIGEPVMIAGQLALVVAWLLVRPRFVLGGALDRSPQLALQVITQDGQDLWLAEVEVTGLGGPARVSVLLPFTGGDQVLVSSTGTRGEVVGWTVTGQRLQTTVRYRVHLAGMPSEDEIEVDARDLEPWLMAPR